MAKKPMAGVDKKADFVSWLGSQNLPEAQYALERWNTASGYNMSGHFHSGFYGIRAFLRAYPKYQNSLAHANWFWQFWPAHSKLENDFAAFVGSKGANFPGQKGGAWRKKLPPRLGGTQTNGGAGSGLVARMLMLLARYGQQKGF
jgi:hypothetical protein